MPLGARFKAMVWNLRKKPQVEAELDDEVRAYVDGLTDEKMTAGMGREEARRAELLEMGGAEQVKQAVRDGRAGSGLERVAHDVRFGIRVLRKSPGFTAVVVLTLALGIGANTAIFSLVRAVLLESIPVKNPGQLVVMQWVAPHWPTGSNSSFGDCGREHQGGLLYGCSISRPFFKEMQGRTDLFSSVMAFAGPAELDLSGNGAASIARGELASGNYFETLGVPAAIGRVLESRDEQPGATAVAVLDYGYWQRAFGGSAGVVGRAIRLNNVAFTIVGVADRGFTRLTPGKQVDLWVTLNQADPMGIPWIGKGEPESSVWWLATIGRLKPGVTRKQAEAAVNVLFRNEVFHNGAKPSFKDKDDPRMTLAPAEKALAGFREDLGEPLLLLMAVVGVVLLIACANVAGLMLARSTARETEMAVRLALGASRRRIVQQLLTESVMLSLAGAALGTGLAYVGVNALVAFLKANLQEPMLIEARPDTAVLAFTVAVGLVTGIVFGLAPALRGARTRAAVEFNRSVASVGRPRSRRTKWLPSLGGSLVVAQVALSLIILTSAGLMLRTLKKLRDVDAGFDTRNLLLFGLDPTLAGYKGDAVGDFYLRLLDRVKRLPGVVSASYSSSAMLDGGLAIESGVQVHGETFKGDTQTLSVGPEFFETMKIPLLRGRTLGTADFEPGKMGAVVNEAFAKAFVRGRDPIGLQFGGTDPKDDQYQILGVVANTKYRDLRDADGPTAYVPQRKDGAMFVLRTAGPPESLMAAVRKTVNEVDSNIPVMRMETQEQTVDRLLFNERLMVRLFGAFAGLALMLACVGLYGMLSFEVAGRTREIGIRTALGAQQTSVLMLFLRRGLLVMLAGSAVGLVAAFLVSRLLESLLFQVKPGDPVTYVAVAALLTAVGLAACLIPATRAARVDPAEALRYE